MTEYAIDFTPVPLLLKHEIADKVHIVTFLAPSEPERAKVIYEGKDAKAAERAFNEIKAHYEARRTEEVGD